MATSCIQEGESTNPPVQSAQEPNKTDALNISLSGESKAAMAARIGLNDNKAGMEGLDKEKINQIIMEASKGSKFYENELKKDRITSKKIAALKQQIDSATEAQLIACRDKADLLLASLFAQYDFNRFIVHMDMDAFYAAVEMRENPKLRDIPMAVGGQDMLSTSNYAARRFGVRAAMPGFIARKLCPALVIVPTNFKIYTAVSMVCRKILLQYDPNMSPMSLDEAYIDFTNHMQERSNLSDEARTFPQFSEDHCRCEPAERRTPDDSQQDVDDDSSDNESHDKVTDPPQVPPPGLCADDQMVTGQLEGSESTTGLANTGHLSSSSGSAMSTCPLCRLSYNPYCITFGLDIEDAVREMRHRIHLQTKLTASAGIAPNCLLAKICSDKNKPNGQFKLPFTTEACKLFMKDLPIRKVPGIGKVSEKQLIAFHIHTCDDFYKQRDKLCYLYSGGSFEYFMSIYMGIGSNVVQRNDDGPKSKSVERTFGSLSDHADLQNMCYELCMNLSDDLKSADLMGKTVTLKIKSVTYDLKTRAQSLSILTNDGEEIFRVASSLLKTELRNAQPKPLKLRLMGIRMSNFAAADSKQSKIPTTIKSKSDKAKAKEHPTITSFFDMVEKEIGNRNKPAEPEPLGLLAYMDNSLSKTGQLKADPDISEKPAKGIERFSLKRKNVWDDLESLPPQKQLKPGTKGTVTICSLLDSDSNSDPWMSFENSLGKNPPPNASTPHTKKVSGPLDVHCAGDRPPSSPWSSIAPSKSAQERRKEDTRPSIRPVQSYFSKTRSVWDEYEEKCDDDIVCISDTPKPSAKVKSKPATRKQSKTASGINTRRRALPVRIKPTASSDNNIHPAPKDLIVIDSD